MTIFLKNFENNVTINSYVEDKVLSGVSNEQERQQQYADWFNNAYLLAQIVYYDKTIENIVKSGNSPSGCRGSSSGRGNPAGSGCQIDSASDGPGNSSTTKNGCTRK